MGTDGGPLYGSITEVAVVALESQTLPPCPAKAGTEGMVQLMGHDEAKSVVTEIPRTRQMTYEMAYGRSARATDLDASRFAKREMV